MRFYDDWLTKDLPDDHDEEEEQDDDESDAYWERLDRD